MPIFRRSLTPTKALPAALLCSTPSVHRSQSRSLKSSPAFSVRPSRLDRASAVLWPINYIKTTATEPRYAPGLSALLSLTNKLSRICRLSFPPRPSQRCSTASQAKTTNGVIYLNIHASQLLHIFALKHSALSQKKTLSCQPLVYRRGNGR
ncbi:hypothetical protein BJV77DRAFT_720212 [Russula vinacea]|nr:hypothetical protein BJV77DRAFT_720212 [Russula vinacea]